MMQPGTQTSETIAVRPDLIQRRIWMGKYPVWVIKDPISGEFFHFGEREHEVLRLANGKTAMQTLHACHDHSELASLSADQLARFLNDAAQKRLASVPGITSQRPTPPKAKWWKQPLAMRLPGVTPTNFLDRWNPAISLLVSWPAMVAWSLLILLAAFLVFLNFDAFTDDVALSMQRLRTPTHALTVMAMIGLAKVVHELAHAFSCRRLGGHVREMGIMFLVGIPCLYCDVSDAWLFDRRWKRMLVSASGIMAELALASVAAIIWVWTVEGPVQDICVTLMVVCSVSTVFFNGNPLLRYDGYYLLSDWVGIPNLASQANALMRAKLRTWLWGTPETAEAPLVGRAWSSGQLQAFLIGYGVLSRAYRLLIMMLIAWWIYRGAEWAGLGSPVGLVLLIAISWFVIRHSIGWLSPPESRNDLEVNWVRGSVRGTLLLAFMLLLTFVPFPRHITAPMVVQARGAQNLYVTTPGWLIQQAIPGTSVREGQPIVVLENSDIEHEILKQESRCEALDAQLENLQKQRSTQVELSRQIPAIERSLLEAERQRTFLREQSKRLIVTSPRAGTLFAPPSRPKQNADSRVAQFWSGTPLDTINHNGWVEQGTVIGMVGHDSQRDAVVTISQEQIELLRIGQSVTVLLASSPRGSIRGVVTEVAVSPEETESTNVPNQAPRSPEYQVRVAIDEHSPTLPVRLQGTARITVDHASLMGRCMRFLAGAFYSLGPS